MRSGPACRCHAEGRRGCFGKIDRVEESIEQVFLVCEASGRRVKVDRIMATTTVRYVLSVVKQATRNAGNHDSHHIDTNFSE